MDYKRKIDFAIKLLRNIPTDSGAIEVSYSGGKDSDVILQLAKMAGIQYEAIYKNTTIDPPGTIQHCREMGVTILQPKMNFHELVAKAGWPSRFSRSCCSELKEYKVRDRAIQGIRREESTKRAARYKEPEYCRTYSAKEKVRVYLPILEWTLEDVTRFIGEQGIKCAPHYYDEQGNFHPERRLGCIGCPLQADCGKAELKKYPSLLKARIRAAQKYCDTHPNRGNAYLRDGYEIAMFVLFFKKVEDFNAVMGRDNNLFHIPVDAKAFLEDYFKTDLTI